MATRYWGVHFNKYQGSDLVTLHRPFPSRAECSFCLFPHTIIVQFSLEGLWDFLVLPKASATAWVAQDRVSSPGTNCSAQGLPATESDCQPLHSPSPFIFFPFSFRRNRARVMFKENPSARGTRCTFWLGQEEKAKAIKLNKKGKFSAKLGKKLSWNPDAVDFKKEKSLKKS